MAENFFVVWTVCAFELQFGSVGHHIKIMFII